MSTETNEIENQVAYHVFNMHKILGSMFHVPLNLTIYDFAEMWNELSSKQQFSTELDILNKNHSMYHVIRMGISPISSVIFDSEDEEDEQDEDELIQYDTPYTYGELVTALMYTAKELYDAAKLHNYNVYTLLPLCEKVVDAFSVLRVDVASKMMNPVAANTIASVAVAIDNIFKELTDNSEE